ncbi:MAG: POTRA domain-containing protein [Bacteroidales bacterium]|nr:POTRA domain-containing protein [Bacteroidales bacterium]
MKISIKHTLFYRITLLIIICLVPFFAFSQISLGDNNLPKFNYNKPQTYEIGGITVSGVKYLDRNVLVMLSGLSVGASVKVPGEEITQAIKKLWDQGLFEDVQIQATKVENDKIFLDIYLLERPRLNRFKITGLKKSEADNIRDEINLTRGDVVTENLLIRTETLIKNYFVAKGFLNTEVQIDQIPDTLKPNEVTLNIDVQKNAKVKIFEINVIGNTALSESKIKSAFKETKEQGNFQAINYTDSLVFNMFKEMYHLDLYGMLDGMVDWAQKFAKVRIFKSSKFIQSDYEDDKMNLIKKYNELGYRDAQIVSDSIYDFDDRSIIIDIFIDEGQKYYYRDITWVGNTKYTDKQLSEVLQIKKGDIYNQVLLETNLNYNPEGADVSSLYMDDGYLFFNIQPVEVRVEGDSIDIELRMYEGVQARINKVSVKGNTRTNDHVVLREARTKPGQLFNRSAVIRTQQELAQMQYFNPEALNLDYQPDPQKGTVDLEYIVEEASTDQIELSGGYGYGRIIATLGLRLNNFSVKNIFNPKAWRPLPSGDGQTLSLSFQTYGYGYWSAGFTFVEPWLGGKKPNALTLSYYFSQYSSTSYKKGETGYYRFRNHGINIGIGRRLKWPDDYFSLYTGIGLEFYNLYNYTSLFPVGSGTGDFYNMYFTGTFGRKSTDNWIYPRSGSDISITLKLTPPYSLIDNQIEKETNEDKKFKLVEYHKWKINASFYQRIIGDLVLSARVKFGFLGNYNKTLGTTPFERFFLGGDRMYSYYQYDGREQIAMRGYENASIVPNSNSEIGGSIYDKFTLELRYPLTLNPTATIFALVFLEAGNCWEGFNDFNPFNVYKAAGVGLRVNLPMFGMIGIDWGYGLDKIPGNPGASGSQFHFSINNSID